MERIVEAAAGRILGLPPPTPPNVTDLAIDIRNVVKRYDQHVAVRDLTLQVPRGAVYGLLGPNDAGKTTTIRMILSIIAPDSGNTAESESSMFIVAPGGIAACGAWPGCALLA